MKLFECQNCRQPLYFENTSCEKCGLALGFLWDQTVLSALISGDKYWKALANPGKKYYYCSTHEHGVCNWLVLAEQAGMICIACQLNRTIPNLTSHNNLKCWQDLESAKHRLVYSLLRLELPITSKVYDPEKGLAFDFLADPPTFRDDEKVITGHKQGIITINIAEADPALREKFRTQMAEPYRTLLGHFRHEVGHYYWERLIRPYKRKIIEFRDHFGDERVSYGDALQEHYSSEPPPDWNQQYVSSYATSHPWEDWAETWAHYMHIVDTLETAFTFKIRLDLNGKDDDSLSSLSFFDPYKQDNFQMIIDAWLPLTYAVNSINRSMGQPDLYPFVLTSDVMSKMEFVHNVIRQQKLSQSQQQSLKGN